MAQTIKDFYPFRISPQLRAVPLNTSLSIPVAKPVKGYELMITRLNVITFSEQADQDLICFLQIGKRAIFQSGLLKIPSGGDFPIPTSELRSASESGGLYNRVSSTTGLGFPDNFPPESYISYPVKPDEVVSFQMKNQSVVYDHSIMVDLEGVLFSREQT